MRLRRYSQQHFLQGHPLPHGSPTHSRPNNCLCCFVPHRFFRFGLLEDSFDPFSFLLFPSPDTGVPSLDLPLFFVFTPLRSLFFFFVFAEDFCLSEDGCAISKRSSMTAVMSTSGASGRAWDPTRPVQPESLLPKTQCMRHNIGGRRTGRISGRNRPLSQ